MTDLLPPLSDLVPHSPPSLLLDELIYLDDDRAITRVSITEDSPFIEAGSVPAIVMIEYMAQTIAAFSGAQRSRQGLPVQFGFLLGCREMTLDVDDLQLGADLRVSATRVWSSETLGQFECEVSIEGRGVARATLNVFEGQMAQGRSR